MGVDEGNLQVMGVERCILTSRSYRLPGRNQVKMNCNSGSRVGWMSMKEIY